MLDFIKIKTDLEDNFNRERSVGVDIDINVNVLSESNGKFSVSVFEEKVLIANEYLPNADITVGFVDKDTMIDNSSPLCAVVHSPLTHHSASFSLKSVFALVTLVSSITVSSGTTLSNAVVKVFLASTL